MTEFCLEFFTKTIRGCQPNVYIPLFQQAVKEDPVMATKLLMNLRDIQGKGEKKISRTLLFCLKISQSEVYEILVKQLCESFGCWKDLLYIMEMSEDCEIEYKIFANQLNEDIEILNNNLETISLIGKWAPSEKTHFNKFAIGLAKYMNMSPKEYRKMLVRLRTKINIVESLMNNGKWDLIVFDNLPAEAHSRYRKTFLRDCNTKGIKNDVRMEMNKKYKNYLKTKDVIIDIVSETHKANYEDIINYEPKSIIENIVIPKIFIT